MVRSTRSPPTTPGVEKLGSVIRLNANERAAIAPPRETSRYGAQRGRAVGGGVCDTVCVGGAPSLGGGGGAGAGGGSSSVSGSFLASLTGLAPRLVGLGALVASGRGSSSSVPSTCAICTAALVGRG